MSQYHEFFSVWTALRCPGMAAGAVSLRKSHDIIILSFCNIVKGRATYEVKNYWAHFIHYCFYYAGGYGVVFYLCTLKHNIALTKNL